jgi:hypothetical protein
VGSIAARLRAQRPALASSVFSGPAAFVNGAARSKAADTGASPPLVVNFSPTVNIHGAAEPSDLERRVAQAIERRSHELVRIVSRERQSQRRAAF